MAEAEANKSSSPEQSAPNGPSISIQNINVCDKEHQFQFFCTNCNSVFCGKCWFRKHTLDARSHEVFELEDKKDRNTVEIEALKQALQNLSGTLDSALLERTRELYKTDYELTAFVSEVLRQLMRNSKARHLCKLYASRRVIISSISEANSKMPEEEIILTISAQYSLLQRLQETNDMVRRILDDVTPKIALCDAVEKTLVLIKPSGLTVFKTLCIQSSYFELIV